MKNKDVNTETFTLRLNKIVFNHGFLPLARGKRLFNGLPLLFQVTVTTKRLVEYHYPNILFCFVHFGFAKGTSYMHVSNLKFN